MKNIKILIIVATIISCQTQAYSQIKHNNLGPHRPYYNPGGQKFSEDKEFAQSYNKKMGVNNNQKAQFNPNNPPGILISSHVPAKFSKKDLSNKSFRCIDNKDIPDEIKKVIVDQCVPQYKTEPTSITANYPNFSKPKLHNITSKKSTNSGSSNNCDIKIKNKRNKTNKEAVEIGEIKFR